MATLTPGFLANHPVACAQGFYLHTSPRREPGDGFIPQTIPSLALRAFICIQAPGASRGMAFFPPTNPSFTLRAFLRRSSLG
jgi:hypothetical protein